MAKTKKELIKELTDIEKTYGGTRTDFDGGSMKNLQGVFKSYKLPIAYRKKVDRFMEFVYKNDLYVGEHMYKNDMVGDPDLNTKEELYALRLTEYDINSNMDGYKHTSPYLFTKKAAEDGK